MKKINTATIPLFGYAINTIINHLFSLRNKKRLEYLQEAIKTLREQISSKTALIFIIENETDLRYTDTEPKKRISDKNPKYIERDPKLVLFTLDIINQAFENSYYASTDIYLSYSDFHFPYYEFNLKNKNENTTPEYLTESSISKINSMLKDLSQRPQEINIRERFFKWNIQPDELSFLKDKLYSNIKNISPLNLDNLFKLFEDSTDFIHLQSRELPLVYFFLSELSNAKMINGEIDSILKARLKDVRTLYQIADRNRSLTHNQKKHKILTQIITEIKNKKP